MRPYLFAVAFAALPLTACAGPLNLARAAAIMGAGKLTIFRRVTFPLSLPGVVTGALLVFIAAFTDLDTPIIIGERFRVLPVLIYGEFVNEFGGRPVLASSLSVILFAVTTCLPCLDLSSLSFFFFS